MKEDGGCDDDRVYIAGEKVVVVLVDLGIGDGDVGFGVLDAIVEDVAESDEAGVRVLHHPTGVEGAASACADQADGQTFDGPFGSADGQEVEEPLRRG